MSMSLSTSTAMRSLQPIASHTVANVTKAPLCANTKQRCPYWFLQAWRDSTKSTKALSRRQLLGRRSGARVYTKVTGYDNEPDNFRRSMEDTLKDREEWQKQFLLEKAVVAPQPQEYQQTVRRSFTRAGVGLHSGAPVTVRVRPAFAGEGRYFVKVPPGTIEDDEGDVFIPDVEGMTQEEIEDKELEYFRMSLLDGEDRLMKEKELFPEMEDRRIHRNNEKEEPTQGESGEVRVAATMASVVSGPLTLCTRLASEDSSTEISTVEHLLSALEACGVDNARIEMEEGDELPILDGSPEGWTLGVRETGLAPARDQQTGEERPRLCFEPTQPVMVSNGDAFVMLNPEKTTRLTYMVDFSKKAKVIGKQSFSWCPLEDDPYPIELSRARTFTTMEDVEGARDAGLIKGGSPSNALIADGNQWYNPPLRYHNEAVRHKMCDLIGDLALLNVGGNGGLPIGHIVANKAGHDLHIKFAKAILEACKEEDRVPSVVKSS